MTWTVDRSRVLSPALIAALALAFLGMGLFPTSVQAQEEGPEAERLEGVTWNYVSLIDFKPGKEDRAMEIIENQWIPVLKKADNQIPRTIELQTGPWDVMLVVAMEDGPSEMTWETSPDEVENMKTAQEMHGEEKIKEISDEYSSTIARTTSFIGYSGKHGAPITADMQE